jgi:hypothetical protein
MSAKHVYQAAFESSYEGKGEVFWMELKESFMTYDDSIRWRHYVQLHVRNQWENVTVIHTM